MIIESRRLMRDDEAGQALVLGAVSLLILSLAVLVTIEMGWAIDQRIKVQNAADNGAYSAAAVVARSLNFISFVNRASVSNYVAMMAAQSLSSYLTGIQTLMWMLADLVQALSAIFCYVAAVSSYLENVPWIGFIFKAISAVFGALSAAAATGAKILYLLLVNTWAAIDGIDKAMVLLNQGIAVLNNTVMFNVAKMMKTLTGTILDTSMVAGLGTSQLDNFQEKIFRETAGNTVNKSGNATADRFKMAMGGLNGDALGSYGALFDKDSIKIKEGGSEAAGESANDSDMVQNAERTMVEIVNASRPKGNYGIDLSFETSRGFGGDNAVAKFLGWIYVGSSRLTKSMSTSQFTEGTGTLSGDAQAAMQAATGAATECKDANTACQAAEQQAAQARTTASQSQQKCDSDTAACNANPGTPVCDTATASCDKAKTDAQARDDKEAIREQKCDDAKAKCEKLEGKGDQADSDSSRSSAADTTNGQKNNVFENGKETSDWSRGGALATAEFVKATSMAAISGGSGRIVGIQSFYKTDTSTGKAYHCRLANKSSDNEDNDHQYNGMGRHYWMAANSIPVCPGSVAYSIINAVTNSGFCPAYAYTKDTKCYDKDTDCPDGSGCDREHKWWGVAPYYSFNPQPDKAAQLFGQPEFWGLVNKAPEDCRFPPDLALGFTSRDRFVWTNYTNFQGGPSGGADLNDIGKVNKDHWFPGLNGWARAMTYYHRPGAWAEPPNLFNPYWKAKLSPLLGNDKLMTIAGMNYSGPLVLH